MAHLIKSIENAMYKELDRWIDENEDAFIPDGPLDVIATDFFVPTVTAFPSAWRSFDAVDSKFGGNTVASLIADVILDVSELSYQLGNLISGNIASK
jgi:hypothetical protein